MGDQTQTNFNNRAQTTMETTEETDFLERQGMTDPDLLSPLTVSHKLDHVAHQAGADGPSRSIDRMNGLASSSSESPANGKDNNTYDEGSNRNNSMATVFRNNVLAGSFAGVSSTMVFHPLDVLRTKMQAGALNSATAKPSGASRPPVCATSSPLKMFARTIRHGGYRSLYTGMSLPVAAQALYKATVFSVNNVSRSVLIDWRTQERQEAGIFEPVTRLNVAETFLCGALGGAVTGGLFVTPVELVRNQLIAQHSRLAAAADAAGAVKSLPSSSFPCGKSIKLHKDGQCAQRALATLAKPQESNAKHMRGPIDVVRNVLRTDGAAGMWRGALVTITRDSLGCGLFFTMFEIGKRHFATDSETGERSILGTALTGALAGLGYWMVALPLDTVKTLVQTGSVESAYSTMADVWRRDGIVGLSRFYKGWQVAYGRGIPAAVVTIGMYEFCINLLAE